MIERLFYEFNNAANNNFGTRRCLPEVIQAYGILAKAMGKEEIAKNKIAELPPAYTLNNKDPRLEAVIATYREPVEEQIYDKHDRVR